MVWSNLMSSWSTLWKAKGFRGVKLVGEKAAAVYHVDRTRGSGPGHRIVT